MTNCVLEVFSIVKSPADFFQLFCFTLRAWLVYIDVFGPVVLNQSQLLLSLSLSFFLSLSLSVSFSFSHNVTMSLVPQFGSSFATFRPALSHSGSTRPLSVILPVTVSPSYNRPSGSSSSSPTSKVPIWKVCSPFASIPSVARFLLLLFNTFHFLYVKFMLRVYFLFIFIT